jgi:hypothetical protein
MTTVNVMGIGWTAEVIADLYATEAAFLAEFVPMEGIYSGYDVAAKTANLKLAYSLCVPAKPPAKPEPAKATKQEPIPAAKTDGDKPE